MPVKILLVCNKLDVLNESPVFFPEAPVVGDLIIPINVMPHHSEERKNFIHAKNENGWGEEAVVKSRTWCFESPEDGLKDPYLMLKIEMVKR